MFGNGAGATARGMFEGASAALTTPYSGFPNTLGAQGMTEDWSHYLPAAFFSPSPGAPGQGVAANTAVGGLGNLGNQVHGASLSPDSNHGGGPPTS